MSHHVNVLRESIYAARVYSGDAVVAYQEVVREHDLMRRVIEKLKENCPELVMQAELEVALEE